MEKYFKYGFESTLPKRTTAKERIAKKPNIGKYRYLSATVFIGIIFNTGIRVIKNQIMENKITLLNLKTINSNVIINRGTNNEISTEGSKNELDTESSLYVLKKNGKTIIFK